MDRDRKVVTCPAGKESISWHPNTYPQNDAVFEARFAQKDCTPCPFRARCTKAQKGPRMIGLQAREHHEARQSARRQQMIEGFRSHHAARGGIDGTHKEAMRRRLAERKFDAVVDWLRGFMVAHPPRRLYLSSRIVGYRGLPSELFGWNRSPSRS